MAAELEANYVCIRRMNAETADVGRLLQDRTVTIGKKAVSCGPLTDVKTYSNPITAWTGP
jgi:hypothetical protein